MESLADRVERRAEHVRQLHDLHVRVVLDVRCAVVEREQRVDAADRAEQRNELRL